MDWFKGNFTGKIYGLAPHLMGKSMFFCRFRLKPIFGQLPLLPFTNYELPPARKKNTAPGKSHLPDLEA